jgi:DNA polymerase (family 10)
MTKNEIADVLTEIGTLLELKGENPFKTRAYLAGARVLESLEQSELDTLVREERLKSVKGIGDALVQKITELHTTGRLEFFEKLKASIEPGLVAMLEVPGLGPKKIKAVHDLLGITTIEGLAAACTDGRVAALAGFGEKSQEKILAGIRNREAYGKRHMWWEAEAVAMPIVAGLRALPQVSQAEAAGSLRRGLETVGDLDFIVAATEVAPVVEWFVTQPGVKEVTARGDTKASVRFESGLQADLRLVPAEQFAFALHHFTGSKDHNVQMRQRALARGLSLSEWGLVPSEGEGTAKEKVERSTASAEATPNVQQPTPNASVPEPGLPATSNALRVSSETALFAALGLSFIPPELREGMGEIEAAEAAFNVQSPTSNIQGAESGLPATRYSLPATSSADTAGALPRLIELADLRGAFHNHTTASDGRNTLVEMTAAAEALGWEYLGIADHSKSSFQAKGLSEERLAAQVAEIRALNASGRFKTHVFTGTECDILPDGRLDFDDGVLATLDYVVVSVHNVFMQSADEMTARIIRAIENPHATMLGHATGRLLLRREGYAVDLVKVIDAAIANHVIIELNASPWRLDLDWRHWKKAAARGLLCAINPDAHETEGLTHVRAGINSARKGWLTKEQVLNTRPLAEVKAWLAARQPGER